MIYHMLEGRKEKDYFYRKPVVHMAMLLFIYILRNYEPSTIVSNSENHRQGANIVTLIAYITVNVSHIILDSLVWDYA